MKEEKKQKPALIDKKQLGIDAVSATMVMGGLMLGNVLNKVIPLENTLIKSGAFAAAGVGAMFIPIKNETAKKFVKPMIYGFAAYSVISLIRAAFVGDSVTAPGTAGIGNIGATEGVQKIVNLLFPTLGDAGQVSVSNFGDHVYDIEQNMVEDQETQYVNGFEDMAIGTANGNAFDALAA